MKRYMPRWSPGRWSVSVIWTAACGCSISLAVGWLFYRHLLACLIIMPMGLAFIPLVQAVLRDRRRRVMQLEFSRLLQSLISALYAGHSLESAFREIEKDMKREAGQEVNSLSAGVSKLNQRITLGESIEKAVLDLAAEWELEDMKIFAETLAIFRRNGGNLLLHLRRTAELIIEKIEAGQDVQVILARKQTEAFMMNAAPYVMISLIIFGSPEYAEPLFSGTGRIVMTGSLVLIAAGHIWTFRMLGRNRM